MRQHEPDLAFRIVRPIVDDIDSDCIPLCPVGRVEEALSTDQDVYALRFTCNPLVTFQLHAS